MTSILLGGGVEVIVTPRAPKRRVTTGSWLQCSQCTYYYTSKINESHSTVSYASSFVVRRTGNNTRHVLVSSTIPNASGYIGLPSR